MTTRNLAPAQALVERAYANALIKLAVGAAPGLSSPAPWTGGKSQAPALKAPAASPMAHNPALSRPASMPAPAPSAPLPPSAPKPGQPRYGLFGTAAPPQPMHMSRITNMQAPQDYRGKGMPTDLGWTPERSQFMKTTRQLDEEQGIHQTYTWNDFGKEMVSPQSWKDWATSSGNFAPRYGVGESLVAGTRGALGAGLGGAAELVGNLARPLAMAGDAAGRIGGYELGLHEGLKDNLAAAADMRARGLHQLRYNTRSRALDDRLAANTQTVNQHGTAANKAWNAAATGVANIAPEAMVLAGGAGALGAGAKLLPGAQAVMQTAKAAPVLSTAAGMATGLTTSVPVQIARIPLVAKLNAMDAQNAEAGKPTNYSMLAPAEYAKEQFDTLGAPVNKYDNAQTSFDANGQMMVDTPGQPSRPMSQVSPEHAQSILANPLNERDLGVLHATGGDVPNNVKTPEDRVLSGTATDPYQRNKLEPPTQESIAQMNAAVEAGARPGATPEEQQKGVEAFQDHMARTVAANPEHRQGAADLANGANTPEAQQFREHLDTVGQGVMTDQVQQMYAANPGATPQQAGSFYAQAANMWDSLGTPGQILVGLGGGIGLVTALMSMMGGSDGLGSLLPAILGLGAAGMGLAGSGAFGQGGQDFVGNMIGSMGQATGMIPKSLTQEQKTILTSPNPIDAAMKMNPTQLMTREQAAQKVKDIRAQFGQLGMLNNLGGMQNSIFQRMGLSPEEAQLAAKNTGVLMNEYNNNDSALSKKLQSADWYSKPNQSGVIGAVTDGLARGWNWLSGKQGSAHMNIAQQIWMQNEMMKAARCWAGYEPVPGSKAYTDGSCRPVGSTKTQAEMNGKKPEKKKTEKSSSNECCGAASVPEHTSQEPTKQIAPKPAVISHSKKVLTSDPSSFGDAIKAAFEAAAAGRASVFTKTKKPDENELKGAKPSHENSKELKISRPEPKNKEDLRPEEVSPKA